MRAIVSLLFVLGTVTSTAGAEPVGFFASLEGEVEVAAGLAPGVYSWEAARQDGAVEIGDRVRTALGASARIVLADDTLLHIAEDTEIQIESYHLGAAATSERSVVRQTRGRLRTIVGDAFGGSTRIEIHTPTAVAGVKGTDLETADASLPGRPRWNLCCHDGGISVTNPLGVASPPPGQCVRSEPGRPPSAPFRNPRAPYEAATRPDVDGGDFTEEVLLTPPPPASDEPREDDDLRLFDLPAPPNPQGFSITALP